MGNSTTSQSFCPRCAKPGRAVKEITLRSLLREEFRSGIEGKSWQFCTTPKCPIVYFESGGTTFHKDQVTVRVGIKETTSPRPVCYCFHHTVEEIEDDIVRTGKTGVPDDIKARMKEACWCETTSPMGGCCLATVNGFVKNAMNRHGQSMPSAVTSAHDCCAVDAGHGKSIPATDRRGLWAGIGAVLAAIASSACCWLPLVLLAFGASAVGVATFFEAWRPWFLTGSAILLALGFYFSYFRKTTCQPGDACAAPSPRLRRMNRTMLWIAAVFVAAFALFPNHLGLLLRDTSAETPPTSASNAIVLMVQGMTCEACAIGIENPSSPVPTSPPSMSITQRESSACFQPTGTRDPMPPSPKPSAASDTEWIMTPKRKFPVKTKAVWATHRSNPINTAMKNTLLYSSLFALVMSGNLRANEPATLSAGQPSSAANTSAFSETFDTGYGYRRGSYGYPYGRGRGYGRGGGYGYRGRGCY